MLGVEGSLEVSWTTLVLGGGGGRWRLAHPKALRSRSISPWRGSDEESNGIRFPVAPVIGDVQREARPLHLRKLQLGSFLLDI